MEERTIESYITRPSPIPREALPKHIAFIMDGNGRWAKSRGLPREMGHKEGAKVFRRLVEYCGDIGIPTVTVYAFSTENWRRPAAEVNAILALLQVYIDDAFRTFREKGIRILFLGDLSPFPPKLRSEMERLTRESAGNPRTLCIAVNYGGRDEILHAVNRLIERGQRVERESEISDMLYTAGLPDPDLILRTAGEKRLSNFLLWQAAYAELLFCDTLWPDMTEEAVDDALREYARRTRRFGGV